MTDQTVAETETEAKPSAEAESAQEKEKTLDELLNDVPESKTEPTKTEDNSQLERRLAELERIQSANNAQKAVDEFRNGGFEGVKDSLLKGFLNERLLEDEKLAKAWVTSKRGEIMEALRKEFSEQMGVKPSSNKPVASAVRSAQSVTPKPKEDEAKYHKKLKSMTQAEFRKHKAELLGQRVNF